MKHTKNKKNCQKLEYVYKNYYNFPNVKCRCNLNCESKYINLL